MSLIKASGAGEVSTGFYNNVIDQSLRYDYSDSPYLTRTGDSGNRRTFTFSAWFKRSSFNQTNSIFGAVLNGSNFFMIRFRDIDDPDGGKLQIGNYSGSFDLDLRTSQVFRDLTNWYHIVVAVDTTQSTASDRVKLYVNGAQVTSFSTATYPSQNFETRVSNGHSEQVGAEATSYSYIDGYLAEVNFIDGTALTPSSFGETKNGVWIPKAISGLTYGTNGFRLTFADSSSLGDDTSGNGNDFTSSGLASTDVVLDRPENNFCTLNPLNTNYNRGQVTISRNNLRFVSSSTNRGFTTGTMKVHGKVYFEVLSRDGNNGFAGIQNITNNAGGYTAGQSFDMYNGTPRIDGSAQSGTGTFSDGDIMGVAVDVDAKSIQFFRNNVSKFSGNYTIDEEYFPFLYDSSGGRSSDNIANFGQDSSFTGEKTSGSNNAQDDNGQGDFYYAPPSGFLALCSANLPDVTIGPDSDSQADDHFNSLLWTGTGSSADAKTGVGFQPDWLWAKDRNYANNHILIDSSRGVTKYLQSSQTSAELTDSNILQSFDSDGFTTVGQGINFLNVSDYVAWLWKANGGTTTTNDASSTGVGTIDSVIQANTTAGFSIVTYTGTGSVGSYAHGLGTKPELIITKERNNAENWLFYTHADDQAYLYLNLNNARSTGNNQQRFGNDSSVVQPTSTIVSIGTAEDINTSSSTYVAYLFAEIEGYSKFGSYTGNGNADGTFVFTGFRPAWVLIKQTNSTGSWLIHDNKRSPFNVIDEDLFSNLASAESDNGVDKDFLSNGFKHRASHSAVNGSSSTYIYMAFAEQPFKFSNAR